MYRFMLHFDFFDQSFDRNWCSVSKSVHHVFDQCSNVPQDILFGNFVFDLNCEVRLCCEIALGLCVVLSNNRKYSQLIFLFTKSVYSHYKK